MHGYSSTRFVMSLTLATGLFAAGLALASSHGAKQLQTAHEHATYAAKSETLEKHQMHLQHVVNCLVGKEGEGYDDSAGNPCDGMGEGAMHDMSGSDAANNMLKQAAQLARIGTQMESAEATNHVAQAVVALLQEANQQN